MSEPLDTLRTVCGIEKGSPTSAVYTAIGLINHLKATNKAMESVLAKIGKHFEVVPGDVDGLFVAIEASTNTADLDEHTSNETKEWIVERLHNRIGLCMFCGASDCSHKGNTELPETISKHDVLWAINLDNHFDGDEDKQ